MKETQYQPTITDALWPQTGLRREVLLILAGSLLVALTAQIEIPLWPVPVTGQTFGVLLVAGLLGRRAAWSMVAYLGEGALGLPFFAGGAAGISQLVGPTGGYLVGFVVAAYVVGWLCEQGWDREVKTAVLVFTLGNLVIYAFGLLWLARFVSANALLQTGLIPFIPGDILKIILAALALPVGWRVLQK